MGRKQCFLSLCSTNQDPIFSQYKLPDGNEPGRPSQQGFLHPVQARPPFILQPLQYPCSGTVLCTELADNLQATLVASLTL